MLISDFDYVLPPELIAQEPPAHRGASRLLAVIRDESRPRDLQFDALPGLLRPGDLLVVNDTRVVKARLHARKASGGRVEILIERALDARRALAHLRANRPPGVGGVIELPDGERAVVTGRRDGLFELELSPRGDVHALMASHGEVPLPPYIQRPAGVQDEVRYQTVFAARDGAVAAPTAGLHFDESVLERIRARDVAVQTLTLHVGAGTFQPVRGHRVEEHVMHAEWFEVGDALCAAVARARASGGRVVAVGTTCVRALESAAAGGELAPCVGDTRLFIRPGFAFRVVDALVTNFHLPRSTLLMLVAAFAGTEPVLAAYRHAVAAGYRFFSYGDAMYLERAGA